VIDALVLLFPPEKPVDRIRMDRLPRAALQCAT
jgi:hypothetical protein